MSGAQTLQTGATTRGTHTSASANAARAHTHTRCGTHSAPSATVPTPETRTTAEAWRGDAHVAAGPARERRNVRRQHQESTTSVSASLTRDAAVGGGGGRRRVGNARHPHKRERARLRARTRTRTPARAAASAARSPAHHAHTHPPPPTEAWRGDVHTGRGTRSRDATSDGSSWSPQRVQALRSNAHDAAEGEGGGGCEWATRGTRTSTSAHAVLAHTCARGKTCGAPSATVDTREHAQRLRRGAATRTWPRDPLTRHGVRRTRRAPTATRTEVAAARWGARRAPGQLRGEAPGPCQAPRLRV